MGSNFSSCLVLEESSRNLALNGSYSRTRLRERNVLDESGKPSPRSCFVDLLFSHCIPCCPCRLIALLFVRHQDEVIFCS